MTGGPGADGSLYGRLGGHEPVAAVVDVFSRRVTGDAELAPYFAGLAREALRREHVAFLAAVLGGPEAEAEPARGEAARSLRLTSRHFRLAAGHLTEALRACGVAEVLVAEVLGAVAGRLDGDAETMGSHDQEAAAMARRILE